MADANGALPAPLLSDLEFLLDPSSHHVSPDSILHKVLGILIGPHWLPVALEHAVSLILDPFKELQNSKKNIAFVYVAADRDEELIATLRRYGQTSQIDERPDLDCFQDVVKKLPEGWLAVPFEDSETRDKLGKLYKTGIFSLAFVGADGQTHTKDGLRILEKWGAEAYPFDDQRIEDLYKAAQEKKENQNLKDLLVHEERDYLISSNGGQQIKVADLEGKTVAFYFSAHWCPPCQKFTPVLAGIYKQLKEQNEDFEIVFVSSDEDQASFDNYFNEMPWLAVPYSDLKTKKSLNQWFEVEGIPTLVILDKQGKTLQTEGMEIIYKYGIQSYPFTAERLHVLEQEEEAKRASQTLETLLVTDERDFVISKEEPQVKISSLKGKTVGLYFSGHWCPPCQKFTPKLKSVYDELKAKGEEFEIIFISNDRDEEAFKEYYESMPWLALPYNDKLKRSLAQYFDLQGIPQFVIIGPDGKTVTTGGRGLISSLGANAFPFTPERIAEVKESFDAKAETLPKERTTSKHEHALTLTADAYEGRPYICDDCDEQGAGWVYHCEACGFDLHPDCVGENEKAVEEGTENEKAVEGGTQEGVENDGTSESKAGFVCEGDVCRKV